MVNKKNKKRDLVTIVFGVIVVLIAAFLFFSGTDSIGALAIIPPICIFIGSILLFLGINLARLR